MAQPIQLYSPKQVASALNVSESSVKRWCDRGIIASERTAGGHRRIPLEALSRFLATGRQRILHPEVLGLDDEVNLREFAAGGGPVHEAEGEAAPTGSPAPAKRLDAFAEALAEGDAARCQQLVEAELARLGSIALLADHLLAPTMERLGDRWDCGELSVYRERRACEICRQLIYDLRPRIAEPSPAAPVAVGAAPAGDPYQLPTLLVEMALRECGIRAESLGNDIPYESLAEAVRDYAARLVWISASSIADIDTFVESHNAFVAGLPTGTLTVIGGRAMDDAVRPRLRYTAHCDSLGQLRQLASLLVPGSR